MENVIHPQQSKLWGTRSFERVVPLEILVSNERNKNINSKVELQLIKGFSCITSKKKSENLVSHGYFDFMEGLNQSASTGRKTSQQSHTSILKKKKILMTQLIALLIYI